MKIKTFVLNKNNKIELTEKQLKQLLDETYWEGYWTGSQYYYNPNKWTYVSPSITCGEPQSPTIASTNLTIKTEN